MVLEVMFHLHDLCGRCGKLEMKTVVLMCVGVSFVASAVCMLLLLLSAIADSFGHRLKAAADSGRELVTAP